MSSVASAQVMMDIYESYFHLYNHLDPKKPNRPFASVALHPAEVLSGDGNRLEKSMETYIVDDIKNLFDVSYIDFMELPSSVVKSMLKVARKHKLAKKKQQEELEAQLSHVKSKSKS